MEWVICWGCDQRGVVWGLNGVLCAQLSGQFISVAYLWLDVENRKALYSAAGHPPLLRWRQGTLERIESNGLLFGVRQDCEDYPVCAMPLPSADQFLLYPHPATHPPNSHSAH